MKKVLILTRFRGEYEPTRLKKEALALGYEVDVVNYEQVRLGVTNSGKPEIDLGTGKDLDEYDLVIPRAASARGKIAMTGVKTVILEYLEKYNEAGRDLYRFPPPDCESGLSTAVLRRATILAGMTRVDEIASSPAASRNDTESGMTIVGDCHAPACSARCAAFAGRALAMTEECGLPRCARNDKKRNDRVMVVNGRSFKLFPLMGKLEQGIMLSQAGLPAIPFQSFNGKKGWRNYLASEPVLPVMVKMRFGSHGKGVKLAETREKLEKLAEKYSEGTVLIQPVLKVRRWYRVIVLGGRVLGMMAHRQKGKFQTEEIKVGVKDVRPDFSEAQFDELKQICVKACSLFECDYAGLDVAWEEDEKRWIIFEINRTAQFKWFEKAHPEINVARQLVSF